MAGRDQRPKIENSYVSDELGTTLAGERLRARRRLSFAFPTATLIHEHIPGSNVVNRCEGRYHELWRPGKAVRKYTGRPSDDEILNG